MDTLVRESTGDDAERIAEVCATAFQATYESFLPSSYIARSISNYYTVEKVRSDIPSAWPGWSGYLVAEEQGVVVGAAGGGLLEPATAELYVIYLDPQKRGNGIGTMLLDRFVDAVSEQGAQTLQVHVIEGNNLGTPFYLARGFTPVEVAPAYGTEPDEAINAIKMCRKLHD